MIYNVQILLIFVDILFHCNEILKYYFLTVYGLFLNLFNPDMRFQKPFCL
jgi:hypothetical protein